MRMRTLMVVAVSLLIAPGPAQYQGEQEEQRKAAQEAAGNARQERAIAEIKKLGARSTWTPRVRTGT